MLIAAVNLPSSAVADHIRSKTSFYFFNFILRIVGHTFGEPMMVKYCGWSHPVMVWSAKKWTRFEISLALKFEQSEEREQEGGEFINISIPHI